jgi:protein-S-isoprenylcysteine O-methyltransferase Ste14
MANLALLLQTISLAAVILLPLAKDDWYAHLSTTNGVIGLLGAAFGLIIAGTAATNLGNAFTIFPKPKRQGLKTEGLYRFTRNPIYTGLIIFSFSWAHAFHNIPSLIASVILVLALLWKVSFEERYLTELYGEEYRRYKKSAGKFTPWL